MNHRIPVFPAAFLILAALAANNAASQEQGSNKAPDSPKAKNSDEGADAESQIDTFARYAMPGEHHKVLDRMTGQWNLKVRYRMTPDTPPVTSEGTCQRKWILGKRFVVEEFDGGSLALPFLGHAIYGYDSFEKKYTSAWLDTMSTAITTYLGECRNDCKVITFEGVHGDPWTGDKRRSRGVTQFIDDNKHIVEIYEPDSNGRDFLILEIVYTRS